MANTEANLHFILELDELKFISAVDRPAQEHALALLIKRDGQQNRVGLKSLFVPAVKIDGAEEMGLVFGWAMVNSVKGEDYFDLQGDYIDPQSMLKAAVNFMATSRAQDTMHDYKKDGEVVLAWALTPETAKAFGINTDTYGLMIAVKPSPEVLAKFKTGELTGFSIAGFGQRHAVKNLETQETTVKITKAELIALLKDPEVQTILKEEGYSADEEDEEDEEMMEENKRLTSKVADLEKRVEELTEEPLYVSPVTGERYFKRDGQKMIDLAKRADANEANSTKTSLEKRALEEIPNLGPDDVAKVALLGAVETIKDAAVKAKVLEMVKSASNMMADLTEPTGTSLAPVKADSAIAQHQAKIAEYMKVHNVKKHVAMSAVNKANPDLYARVRAERDQLAKNGGSYTSGN